MTTTLGYVRCRGSGTDQMVDWFPDDDYPGASVCIGCSYGVLLRKGSVEPAVSNSGFQGYSGTLRVHYVNHKNMTMTYRKPKKGKP